MIVTTSAIFHCVIDTQFKVQFIGSFAHLLNWLLSQKALRQQDTKILRFITSSIISELGGLFCHSCALLLDLMLVADRLRLIVLTCFMALLMTAVKS